MDTSFSRKTIYIYSGGDKQTMGTLLTEVVTDLW